MTARRQSNFPTRLSLDSQTETGSEFDWDPQTPAKPHFNPFTDFFSQLSISASSSTFLSIPHRFTTTTFQTYHATTTRVPTFRALTARIIRRRRTAVVFLVIIGALILLAIVKEAAPATFKLPNPRVWELRDPIDVAFASVTTVGPSHGRRNSPDLVLEPRQELGVLVAFMAAVTAKLPSHIDPSKPLDQLIVGF